MFNINSLAQGFSEIYDTRKKHIVGAMKRDPNSSWKKRGQRFEAFRPKYEATEPSEWYVPLYALMHPAAVLGFGSASASSGGEGGVSTGTRVGGRKGGEKGETPEVPRGISKLFRRRKQKEEEWEEPQPWVIE